MSFADQVDAERHLQRLGEGAVLSYAFDLSRLPSGLTLDPARLSDAERERYERFRREPGRFAFLAGRCVLRSFLELSLQTSEYSIELEAGGKPYCPHPRAPCFNMSHSAGWLYVGWCRDQALGVDVEESGRSTEVEALSERYLSAVERERVKQKGREEFFRLWTRKEARVKASGEGLRVRLSDLDTLAEEAEGRWRYETVCLADGVVAGLCYAGAPRTHYFTRC